MMQHPSAADDLSDRIGGLMGRLRKDAEVRGWSFYLEPPSSVIPDFLKGFRPDALAIGPEGGTVIEIKTRRQDGKDDGLARIARLVKDQKGWDFRVIYVAPPLDAGADLQAPTPGELASGVAEARTLLDTGHTRAAFLIGWSLLEAAARLISAQSEKALTKALSPIQAVQTLAELGDLSEADARRLRDLASLRNAVVHGSLGAAVPADAVTLLIKVLEEIAGGLVAAV